MTTFFLKATLAASMPLMSATLARIDAGLERGGRAPGLRGPTGQKPQKGARQ